MSTQVKWKFVPYNTNVYDCQTLEKIQIFFNRWILLISVKEWTPDTLNNMDESQMHHAGWRQPNPKGYFIVPLTEHSRKSCGDRKQVSGYLGTGGWGGADYKGDPGELILGGWYNNSVAWWWRRLHDCDHWAKPTELCTKKGEFTCFCFKINNPRVP